MHYIWYLQCILGLYPLLLTVMFEITYKDFYCVSKCDFLTSLLAKTGKWLACDVGQMASSSQSRHFLAMWGNSTSYISFTSWTCITVSSMFELYLHFKILFKRIWQINKYNILMCSTWLQIFVFNCDPEITRHRVSSQVVLFQGSMFTSWFLRAFLSPLFSILSEVMLVWVQVKWMAWVVKNVLIFRAELFQHVSVLLWDVVQSTVFWGIW